MTSRSKRCSSVISSVTPSIDTCDVSDAGVGEGVGVEAAGLLLGLAGDEFGDALPLTPGDGLCSGDPDGDAEAAFGEGLVDGLAEGLGDAVAFALVGAGAPEGVGKGQIFTNE